MMRASLVLGIVFLLISIIIVPSSANNIEPSFMQSFNGNILYVGGSGGDNYTKIQDAINDAVDGDIVYVFDDSSPYYERVNLNKRISLIGENNETTVIDAQHMGNVITVQENDTIISGFTLKNCKASPDDYDYSVIKIVSRKNVIVKNNKISIGKLGFHNTNTGVLLDTFSSNCQIQNNVIYNGEILSWTFGIAVHDGSFDINISGNEIYGYVAGVEICSFSGVKPCSDVDIYNNYIHNNNIGIFIIGALNSIIKNIIINNNKFCENRGYGVYNSFGFNTHITHNIFMNNGNEFDCGLYLDFSSKDYVADNIFSDNNPTGIYLSTPYNGDIVRNNFIGNPINAYFLYGFHLVNRFKWDANYWSDYYGSGSFPKIIFGSRILFLFFEIPWINFDWNPAQEPYDIGVMNYEK